MSQSIYQKVLGNDFNLLGSNLQLAHKTMGTVKGNGTIDVEWGKGFFIRLMCKLNGLPPEGKQQELELEIVRDENLETWNRKFKSKVFTTTQFEKKGLLVEKDGPVALSFKMKVEDGALVYEHVKVKFAGIPVPGFMAMKSRAIATEQENGWKAMVEVTTPLFGLVLRYNASVKLSK